MKKVTLVVLILSLLSNGINANPRLNLKVGTNLTSLRKEKTSWKPGVSFGIGKDWRIFKNLYLGGELLYSNKKGQLKNKSIAPEYIGIPPEYINFYDINCSVDFLDANLLVEYKFLKAKTVEILLFIGPGFSLNMKDRTKIKFLYSVPNTSEIECDYGRGDGFESLLDNSGGNFNLGIYFYDPKINSSFEFRYVIYKQELEVLPHALRTLIYEKIKSFYFLFSVSLGNY